MADCRYARVCPHRPDGEICNDSNIQCDLFQPDIDADALIELADQMDTYCETAYWSDEMGLRACRKLSAFANEIRDICGSC